MLLCIFSSYLVTAQPLFQQKTEIELNVPCTINGNVCSSNATCQATIINPKGAILVNNEAMVQNNATFRINITENQSAENGQYEFPVSCCDNGACATRHLTFAVNPSGVVSSSGEAIVYVILIIVVLVFFIFTMMGAVKIDGEHSYDVGGKLLELKYGKYLKMGLFFVSILFLWFLFFLGWQVSSKVLMFDFMNTIFRTLFMILTYLIAPIFLAFTILAVVQWTLDLKLWKMTKRGLPER